MTAPRPHSQPEGEQDYLEDNIATVAFHMGKPGARLSIAYDGGTKLLVDPGEVLKEASRRLTRSGVQSALGGKTPFEFFEGVYERTLAQNNGTRPAYSRSVAVDELAAALALPVTATGREAIFTCPRCPGFEKWCGDSNCPTKGSEPTAEEIETIMFGVINKLAMTRAHEAYWWLRKEFGSSAVSSAEQK